MSFPRESLPWLGLEDTFRMALADSDHALEASLEEGSRDGARGRSQPDSPRSVPPRITVYRKPRLLEQEAR
jgi:hypothetical protein